MILTQKARILLFFAAKAKTLLNEVSGASKEAPSIMIGGAFLQSILGLVQFILFMAPLKAIFLKVSGVKIITIPGSSLSIDVNMLLILIAAGLLIANVFTAVAGYIIDTKRKNYISELRQLGQRQRANNIGPFYSINKSIIAFVAIFPALVFMDPWFTALIVILLSMTMPLFIVSRRFTANEQGPALARAALNSRSTGALIVGTIVAAAIIHIAYLENVNQQTAIYLLIYFLLLRQLASAIQKAADGFHKVRL